MVDQIQLPSTQAFSGGADFSQLANLGNVYQAAQEKARQQAALASLGNDPTANIQTLIQSRDPTLAVMGFKLQQQGAENTRANAELAIRQAENLRAQGNYEHADELERRARIALSAMDNQTTASPNAVPRPSPFPAPLPGQITLPPAPQQRAPISPPSVAPSTVPQGLAALGPPAPPISGPNMSYAAPVAPPISGPQEPVTPPTRFAGPGVPAAPAEPAASATLPDFPPSPNAPGQPAITVPHETAQRVVDTMAENRPVASSGLSNKQIYDLIANPATRQIGQAAWDNKNNPGTWKVERDPDSGQYIAFNSIDPRKTMNVTPPSQDGQAPTNKIVRDMQQKAQGAQLLGYTPEEARIIGVGGKLPGEQLDAREEARVLKLTDEQTAAQRALDNLNQARALSPHAYGGMLATERAAAVTGALPGSIAARTNAVNTQDMNNALENNVIGVAKANFPQRVTNMDIGLVKDLQGAGNQSDEVRQRIFDRADRVFTSIINENRAEADRIRGKTFFKPGGSEGLHQPQITAGGAPVGGASATAPAAPTNTYKNIPFTVNP